MGVGWGGGDRAGVRGSEREEGRKEETMMGETRPVAFWEERHPLDPSIGKGLATVAISELEASGIPEHCSGSYH